MQILQMPMLLKNIHGSMQVSPGGKAVFYSKIHTLIYMPKKSTEMKFLKDDTDHQNNKWAIEFLSKNGNILSYFGLFC